MTVLTIALAIAVPLGTAALNAWINIKVKFAPDEAHARLEAKLILVTVFRWIAVGASAAWLIYLLIREVQAPLPLTRFSCLFITLNTVAIFNLWMISWTLWLANDLINFVGRHGDAMVQFFKETRLS